MVAAFWAFLLMIAVVRRVWWWSEQPATSRMRRLPCWGKVVNLSVNFGPRARINFYMGNWVHDVPKPTVIATDCAALWCLKDKNQGKKPIKSSG
eukprot:3837311-Pyramimonas_sp.AAC.1